MEGFMSYSADSQKICREGHLDRQNEDSQTTYCKRCGAPFIWENVVETTNGREIGFIDMTRFRIFETNSSEPLYRPPSEEERRELQTYIDVVKEPGQEIGTLQLYYCKTNKAVVP
jgi:hypothetical protein